MEEIIIKKSRKKTTMLMLLCVMLVLLCGVILYAGLAYESILHAVIGGMGFVFFITCLIAWFKVNRTGDKLLILNDKGFYDYSSMIATEEQLIEWSEVSQIQYAEMSGQQFVNIQLKKPEETLRHQTAFAKKMAKANALLGLPGINVNAGIAVGYNGVELSELMNDYLKQHTERNI